MPTTLARRALYLSDPNPRVGCILLGASGKTLGQGFTQAAGQAHAEVMALRNAQARGHDVRGATAYVTLEPCSHFGRTPPCCNALIDAGIGRVVVAQVDPNPLVAGQGIGRLRAAGIEVEVLPPDHPAARDTRALNIGFFSRMIRKTPWVRAKVATSLDGKTALPDGQSQWITSPEARADGHAWRARCSAVLTGIGTVLADNPRLDVRLVDTPRQPHLAIVDSQLRTPPDAALWQPKRQVWIYTASQDATKTAALQARGATVVALPTPDGRQVDLAAVLRDMGQREVNELHVEAGATLNGALLGIGLVDELLVYLAPKLLGQGMDFLQMAPLQRLADALPWQFESAERVGPDLRILARGLGRADFLNPA